MQTTSRLSETHEHMLTKDSAISPDVIEARGYYSIESEQEAKQLGFSQEQIKQGIVPALVLPWKTPLRSDLPHHFQLRPDTPPPDPRRAGKKKEYLMPAGQTKCIDVHPYCRLTMGNPQVPLWITEGIRKGDALVSQDVGCVVNLDGVHGWRGTNSFGGKTVLPDWEVIALNNGRETYICFDSDVMTKPEVRDALLRLHAFLKAKEAQVKLVYLPPGPHGEKVGVDDFFAQGHTLEELKALATEDIAAPEWKEPIDAVDLLAKEFPEPQWAVEGILPEGLTILAGRPKDGKSYMMGLQA